MVTKKKIQKHLKKKMYIVRPVPTFGFNMYRNRTSDGIIYSTTFIMKKK